MNMRRTAMSKPVPPLSPDASPRARVLYTLMIKRGFNYTTLARAAGVGATYVREIIIDKSKSPHAEKLSKVATALGCELEVLTNPPVEFVPPLSDFMKPSNVLPLSEREIALVLMWRALDDDTTRDRVINFLAALLPTKKR